MKWQPTEVSGMKVAETIYQTAGWKRARRLILIRQRKDQKGRRRDGKELFNLSEYLFQALVTSWPQHKDANRGWRHYNKRANCENVIKELQRGFGISGLVCECFHATEGALSLAVLAYKLTVLFQRALGWQTKVAIQSLRFWIFVSDGLISRPQGQIISKFASPKSESARWKRLWEKILCPFPNCNGVENRPAFA
jgi:hypothetical protein